MNHYPLTNDGAPDKRYAIAAEFCGHAERRFVLRFCGDFIASSLSISSLTMRAVGHRNVLRGAPVVTEIRS